jgi:hypothetical protein
VAEGLSATEVGKEIAEHHEHTEHAQRDRLVAIFEAILLSVVALLAAWSGYSAAKWGTESSLSLAKASSTRSKASVAQIKATQIRTLDSVSFNAAETAYASGDAKLFRLAVKRLRPGYRPAFEVWLATHPLKNPNAPADPSYLPQYRIPQAAQGLALTAICATGSYIWLGKRQRRGLHEPRLRSVWDAVVWGSPLILTVTFILRKLVGNDAPLATTYWLASAAMIAAGIGVSTPGKLARLLTRSLAVALLLAVVMAIWMP